MAKIGKPMPAHLRTNPKINREAAAVVVVGLDHREDRDAHRVG